MEDAPPAVADATSSKSGDVAASDGLEVVGDRVVSDSGVQLESLEFLGAKKGSGVSAKPRFLLTSGCSASESSRRSLGIG